MAVECRFGLASAVSIFRGCAAGWRWIGDDRGSGWGWEVEDGAGEGVGGVGNLSIDFHWTCPSTLEKPVARPTITHPHAKPPENGGGQFDSKFNLCGTLPVAMRFGS